MTGEVAKQCYAELADGSGANTTVNKRMAVVDAHLSRPGYRLPTEAEWEYAATALPHSRGSTPFHFGADRMQLWEYASFQGVRSPTAALKPNVFGLFDVHGGLAEWCDDNPIAYQMNVGGKPIEDKSAQLEQVHKNGKLRIVRGGSFESQSAPELARYRRVGEVQRYFAKDIGFRVARTIDVFPPPPLGPVAAEDATPSDQELDAEP